MKEKKASSSRPMLSRLLRIHEELLRLKYPNASTLAKAVEVSSKTIQRDINFMRDHLGLPIAYDAGEHGFYYTQEVTDFPLLQVSEGEILALFVAHKAIAQYRGTPFEGPLQSAFEKLAQEMKSRVSVSLDALARAISFEPRGVGKFDLGIFQQVTDAVINCQELTILYHKLRSPEPELRTVKPYHISCIQNQWYLFAHCYKRDDIRCFVIGRIQEIRQVGNTFARPKDFSISKVLMSSFGVMRGKGDYTVVVEFDAEVARIIRERQWHQSQELEELEDGGVRMTVQLCALDEFHRWILGFGRHAKVLEPAELKQRVRTSIIEMNDHYEDLPGWFRDLRQYAEEHKHEDLIDWIIQIDELSDDPKQLRLSFDDLRRTVV